MKKTKLYSLRWRISTLGQKNRNNNNENNDENDKTENKEDHKNNDKHLIVLIVVYS